MDLSEDGHASLRLRSKGSISVLGTRKKTASSSTRKASEMSTASQASLRSAIPRDEDIELERTERLLRRAKHQRCQQHHKLH